MLEVSSCQRHVGHGSTDSATQHLLGTFADHGSRASPDGRKLEARGVFWDVLTFVHITMQYMRTRAPGVRPPDLLTPRHMCRRISTQRIVASDFATVCAKPTRSKRVHQIRNYTSGGTDPKWICFDWPVLAPGASWTDKLIAFGAPPAASTRRTRSRGAASTPAGVDAALARGAARSSRRRRR